MSTDPLADLAAARREIDGMRTEIIRLRRLLDLRNTEGTNPAPEQVAHGLQPSGTVTMASGLRDKLVCYASLFRARTDVFARFWVNERTQKRGWTPAVEGYWRKGVPLLEQALLPLTDVVLGAHLTGDAFIGLYPLLADETCHFLAADFDGPNALLDALAYLKAARAKNVPAALELSQSGRGAHVWFFFTDAVPAALARSIGLALIHEAITLRGGMQLSAYDRLFPNQDTVPIGGVGNLIAAPLQGERRRNGTSVFLDLATLEPCDDQWAYLSTLDRLTPREAERAARNSPIVVGHQVTRLRRSQATRIHPSLPPQVRVTLGAAVRVTGDDLIPEVAGTLRHAATIANPQFYELQRLHRSTHATPRFIQGFDLTVGGELVLPRGLLPVLGRIVDDAGSRLDITDARDSGTEIEVTCAAELTGEQAEAVGAMLEHDDGILVAPPGSGKTVMACAIVAERAVSTLVLVDRKALAEQWRTRVTDFLRIKPGQLGGGRSKLAGVVDIAILPTLARRDDIEAVTRGYGQIIVDECHHLGAGAYEHSVKQIAARWWLGLTATPKRRDGLEDLVTWQIGPVRHTFASGPVTPTLERPDAGPLRKLMIHPTRFVPAKAFDPAVPGALAAIHGELAADPVRNAQIVEDVAAALARHRRCLILTRRTAHLDTLAESLRAAGHDPMILRGGTRVADRKAVISRLASATDDEEVLLIGTTPYIGEGFDAPVLDTLFLAAPISFPGLLIQAAGRVLRAHPGKHTAEVHDYHDELTPVLAASLARRTPGYSALGLAPMR